MYTIYDKVSLIYYNLQEVDNSKNDQIYEQEAFWVSTMLQSSYLNTIRAPQQLINLVI